MRLRVPRPLVIQIEQAARRQAPRECCGLLIGRVSGRVSDHVSDRITGPGGGTPAGLPRGIGVLQTGQAAVLTRQVPSPNQSTRPQRRFEIDPQVLASTLASVRDGQERVLGVYHSHPRGAALPSWEDARGAWIGGWLWLIVAPHAPAARRWGAWLSLAHGRGFAPVAGGPRARAR